MATVKEIGSISAILAGINTKQDGCIKITFEVNPSEQSVLSELLKAFANNEKLFQIGIVQVSE